MLRITLTLTFVFAGGAAAAQDLPRAPEYPAAFEAASAGAAKAVTAQKGRVKRTAQPRSAGPSPEVAALIARHASANGVPAELAHRVIMRESRYNPSARNRAYWGLMQISFATARGIGYRGPARGLLDPDTNLRYGMAYLGNAYRVAGGDQRRAVRLYASGYYYAAKRQGMLGQLRRPGETPQVATR